MRQLEYSQRLRDRRRALFAEERASTGLALWTAACAGGAQASGTIIEEIVHPADRPAPEVPVDLAARPLTVPLVRHGEPVADLDLHSARARVRDGLLSLPWDGLKLSRGDAAIPTRIIAPTPGRS